LYYTSQKAPRLTIDGGTGVALAYRAAAMKVPVLCDKPKQHKFSSIVCGRYIFLYVKFEELTSVSATRPAKTITAASLGFTMGFPH